MATKYVSIGSMQRIHQYDDADYDAGIETDDVIRVHESPSDPDDVLRLTDLESVWPIGSVFLSVVSTNPGTLLGFGTWSRIAEGQFLIGLKSGDPDFGSAEGSGGNKDHSHDVTLGSATSSSNSTWETVDKNLDGTTVDVAGNPHSHNVDYGIVTTTIQSALPPYFVIYVWKRTA